MSNQTLVLQTNHGNIGIELDFEHTPLTAANFLAYATSGFYDGTIFHRVIKRFMIQGGGFNAMMEQKSVGATIGNEAAFSKGDDNARGTLAMARTSDPHSATAQFFINTSDNKFLNFKSKEQDGWGYCVFGKVIQGMEVVDKIESLATCSKNGHSDVPVDAVVIEKVLLPKLGQ